MEDSTIINSASSKVSQESILPDSRMFPMATSSPSSEEDPINLWFRRNRKETEERFDMINQQLDYYERITDLLEPVKNLIYYNTSDGKSSITSILDVFRVPEEEDSVRYSTTSKKRTRNVSQSSKTTTSRSSHQKIYSTPKKNRNRIATVTPGARMKTPSRVYRQPKDGESVISMNGSPIFVSRPNFTQVPQMHIPLKDGRVYAIMGEDGLKNEVFPNVDSETLDKIKQLHEFIKEQIIRSNNSD